MQVAGAASSVLAADVPRAEIEPVDFESITGNYQITNGVLSTKDLLYTTKTLKVGVAGDWPSDRPHEPRSANRSRTRRDPGEGDRERRSPSVRIDPASVVDEARRQKIEGGLQDLLKRFGRARQQATQSPATGHRGQ